MLTVALTGGIGSGKSAVAARLAELGAAVIDTDLIARELVAPGQPALGEIVDAFGPEVLRPDGSLDRAGLRARVFADPGARRRLEAILHPRIRQEALRRAQEADAPYRVLVIPLLVETGQTDVAERILVVDAPEALQVQRVAARDGQSPDQVRAVLAAQCRRAERLAVADDVIDNGGSLESLLKQTDRLHRRYLERAAEEG